MFHLQSQRSPETRRSPFALRNRMTIRTSHLAGLWIGAAISNRSHSKPVLPLSKEHGSQVKDQSWWQCCHNKHKQFPYRPTRDVYLLSWHASYIIKVSPLTWLIQLKGLHQFLHSWCDEALMIFKVAPSVRETSTFQRAAAKRVSKNLQLNETGLPEDNVSEHRNSLEL
jgi:hypothetical protein